MHRPAKTILHHSKHNSLFILFEISGVILFWRGAWGLMDLYLFPGKPLLSYLFSIALGLLIIYLPDSDIKELS